MHCGILQIGVALHPGPSFMVIMQSPYACCLISALHAGHPRPNACKVSSVYTGMGGKDLMSVSGLVMLPMRSVLLPLVISV